MSKRTIELCSFKGVTSRLLVGMKTLNRPNCVGFKTAPLNSFLGSLYCYKNLRRGGNKNEKRKKNEKSLVEMDG